MILPLSNGQISTFGRNISFLPNDKNFERKKSQKERSERHEVRKLGQNRYFEPPSLKKLQKSINFGIFSFNFSDFHRFEFFGFFFSISEQISSDFRAFTNIKQFEPKATS